RGQKVARARIVRVLWPDHPEDSARRMLTSTLYRLRQTLSAADGPKEASLLVVDNEAIGLGDVSLDIDTFRNQADAGDLAGWRAALDQYHGDLLEDLDAEWVTGPRAELRNQYIATLAHICTAL